MFLLFFNEIFNLIWFFVICFFRVIVRVFGLLGYFSFLDGSRFVLVPAQVNADASI